MTAPSVTMRNLINAVKSLVKLPTVFIDNAFFRLHYQCSPSSSSLRFRVAGNFAAVYFGKPMDCYFPDYTHGSLNDFCSVQPTYLEVSSTTHDVEDPTSVHRVAPSKQQPEIKYYGYYEFIFMALFVQAVFFSIPPYISARHAKEVK